MSDALDRIRERVEARTAAAPPPPPVQPPADSVAPPASDQASQLQELQAAVLDLSARVDVLEQAAVDDAMSEMDTWAADPMMAALPHVAAVTKSEGDAGDFPASDYAYVPDPEQPSTWKLRLTATPGGEPDAAMVGAAAAALSPGGFRGNRVEIPDADRADVVAKVRAAWEKANPGRDPSEMPEAIAA